MKITLEQLSDFLSKANKHTYAADGIKTESTRLASEDFDFKEGDLTYHDTYFGSDKFIGEEIVWKNEKMIWGMNYYGKVLSAVVSGEEIYEFLKKALSQVEDAMPFRGPKAFDEENFHYRNSNSGSVEEFHGIEMILYQESRIYELQYHGGIAKK